MDGAGVPGDLLDLVVELARAVVELRNVGGGVERVHGARGVRSRAAGMLGALQHDDVLRAVLDEVIEHAATDDAAADDRHSDTNPLVASARVLPRSLGSLWRERSQQVDPDRVLQRELVESDVELTPQIGARGVEVDGILSVGEEGEVSRAFGAPQ